MVFIHCLLQKESVILNDINKSRNRRESNMSLPKLLVETRPLVAMPQVQILKTEDKQSGGYWSTVQTRCDGGVVRRWCTVLSDGGTVRRWCTALSDGGAVRRWCVTTDGWLHGDESVEPWFGGCSPAERVEDYEHEKFFEFLSLFFFLFFYVQRPKVFWVVCGLFVIIFPFPSLFLNGVVVLFSRQFQQENKNCGLIGQYSLS